MALDHTELTVGIIISATFWTFLHLVFTPALSRAVLPEYYDKMVSDAQTGDVKAQVKLADWNTRLPGFVHAVIAGLCSMYCCYFDEVMIADKVHNTSKSWLVTCSVAAGFFAWDLCACVYHHNVFGVPFILHAAFCLATYLICGFIQEAPMAWHAASFLMFELSTPILHIRWAVIEFKLGDTAVTVCTYLFALCFFLVRIIWGNFHAIPLVVYVLLDRPKELPIWQAGAFWILLSITFSLNGYW
eukprot:CAMPEP_0114524304 /NCGR_PEP_ID=MMETSP0109-20121206/21778_1 /TAXON_ID=29199 /ORGANISM="Chlorarachnion reptans, Strain CCCM449" /LENGTH=243 /DNA_ID=CAMNT_0001705727 /DNA_START=126 /DNA_END=854 /DNA_ORIENTATION=-